LNPFGPDISGGGGFDVMFTIIPIIMVIGFIVVIVSIIIRSANYAKNKTAPQETVYARIAAKRMEVRHHSNHHHHDHGAVHTTNSSRTYYYITLEFDNGTRREYLDVKNLYGLVVEGDAGYAATQGDWIVAFERNTEL